MYRYMGEGGDGEQRRITDAGVYMRTQTGRDGQTDWPGERE